MLDQAYQQKAKETEKRLKEYNKQLNHIWGHSINTSHDVVQYIVKLLREDHHDHEIGAVLIQQLKKRKYSGKNIIRIIVKLLYVVHSVDKMKYADYHTLKKYIDDELNDPKITQKYMNIIKRLNKEEITQNINKHYRRKKVDVDAEMHLRENILFI